MIVGRFGASYRAGTRSRSATTAAANLFPNPIYDPAEASGHAEDFVREIYEATPCGNPTKRV